MKNKISYFIAHLNILLFSDGALKYRNSISQYHPGNGYTNPCLQTSIDQISTISRPRSSTDALNQSSGSSMHGRQLNGVLSRGANGLHEDLDFPPTPRTLTRKKNVVWMRPHVSHFLFSLLSPDLHREIDGNNDSQFVGKKYTLGGVGQ